MRFAFLLVRLEQDGAEGGRKGKCVQCGETDGDGHGKTELAVEDT